MTRTSRRLLAVGYFTSLLVFHLVAGTHADIMATDPGYGGERHFGYEIGHVAKSLYVGDGFSIRVRGEHGVVYSAHEGGFEKLPIHDPGDDREPSERTAVPTSHVAPLYTIFLAGIFHLFGLMTPAAAWAAIVVNCLLQTAAFLVFQSLTTGILSRKAQALAIGFFFVDHSGYIYSGHVWSQSLYGLLALSILLLVVRESGGEGILKPSRWIATGIVASALLLTDKSALPLVLVAIVWRLWKGGRRELPALAAAAGVAAVLLLPWALRNHRAVETLTPLANTTGIVAFMGNSPGARNVYFNSVMSSFFYRPTEMARYAVVGEKQYDRECMQRALRFVSNDPAGFVRNSAERVLAFWLTPFTLGLVRGDITLAGYEWQYIFQMAWRWLMLILLPLGILRGLTNPHERPVFMLFAALLILFPLIYYVTISVDRYRAPLDPILCIAAARALTQRSTESEA